MAKTLQFRRGTSGTLDAITGAEGEIFVDLDTNTIRVHDGNTEGGVKLATEGYVDSTVFDGDYNSLTNKPDLTVFDNVESFADLDAFPATGEANKVYIANDTGFIYRWSGSAYVQLTDQTAIWGNIGGTLSNQTDLQNALDAKQDDLVSGTNIKTINSESLLGSGNIDITSAEWGNITGTLSSQTDLQNALDDKQDDLVSGTNIKTINNESILGSGNITIEGGGDADLSEVAEDVLPLFDGVFDLGSLDKRWFDVFVENSINIAGATIIGSEDGVVLPSALIDDLLVSENMITPDDSTARQYLGDKGVLVVDGNIDAQGDWMKVPVVEGITALVPGTEEVEVTEEVPGPGAWSSGGNLNTARGYHAGAGTQTAGLAFGGDVDEEGGSSLSSTEEYDGTSWSFGGNLNTARGYHAGAGTQDAGLAFGGFDSSFNTLSSTEEYDGTSWSSGGNLITARSFHAGAGTQTAGLAFGGGGPIASTEEYDGTSWSAGGNLITGRSFHAGAGTQDAALAFGGDDSSFNTLSSTEEYDGTSWSSGGNLNTARRDLSGAGTQTAALAIGGRNSSFQALASTEEYDGTSWSSGGNLNTGRSDHAGAGTQDAGLAFGGFIFGSPISSTEEYNSGFTVTTTTETIEVENEVLVPPSELGEEGMIRYNRDIGDYEKYKNDAWIKWGSVEVVGVGETVFGDGVWSSGGNLITARSSHAGAGTQTAALAFGGSGPLSSTEEYDGTSWSSGGNLITARSSHAGAGTQTAGLAFGGGIFSEDPFFNSTEEYNGSTWSAGGNLPVGLFGHAGAGTQDAALAFGGWSNSEGNTTAATSEYNGTSWSSGGNLITGRNDHAGAGTQTAALAFGGRDPSTFSGNPINSTEEYDGTSWSSGGNLGTTRIGHAGAGAQTAGLAFGGRDNSFNNLSSTEEYNKQLISSVPEEGSVGELRFNKDTGKFEGYNGTEWVALS